MTTTHTDEAVTEQPLGIGTAESSTMLVARYGDLRDRVRGLDSEVTDGHMEALRYDLELRTRARSKESPSELLNGLAEHGFSWTGIARLLGVSTSAIRKWRRGEDISGSNRYALSRLTAFADMLEKSFGIADIASWLEMPLAEPYEVSGIDVYADFDNGWETLTHIAIWPVDLPSLFDQEIDGWRDLYAGSDYEVSHDSDGRPIISRST